MGWLATWTPPLFLLPLVTLGFLLFPDGHLPSRRWRHLAWLATGAMVVLALCLAIAPAPLLRHASFGREPLRSTVPPSETYNGDR